MSQLLMLISAGYRFWIGGEMHYSKAESFCRKMAELCPVEATADQRGWAKKTARYAAHLILFPHEKDPTKIMFWLIATAGSAPKGFVDIHARKKMKDAYLHPVRWRAQYHCLLLGRPGKSKKSWTWAMLPPYFGNIKASAQDAANSGAPALENLFGRLVHMPMFSGIREQLKEVSECATGTWKKRRKSACPDLFPNPLPTMPKIKVWGDLTLQILVQQMIVSEQEAKKNGEAQALQIMVPATRMQQFDLQSVALML